MLGGAIGGVGSGADPLPPPNLHRFYRRIYTIDAFGSVTEARTAVAEVFGDLTIFGKSIKQSEVAKEGEDKPVIMYQLNCPATLDIRPNDLMVGDSRWTVSIAGATGGTYTLTYDGQTTDPIDYDSNAAAIQADLTALANISLNADGNPNVIVADMNSQTFKVEFVNDLSYTGALFTGDGSSLVGASLAMTQREYEVVDIEDADITYGGYMYVILKRLWR
jgi:hypothetical protein